MIPATTLAAKSDIGILHQIPADPQQRGSRMMLGSKNNNCRVNDRKMALPGHADTLKKIGRYHLKPDNGKKYDYNA